MMFVQKNLITKVLRNVVRPNSTLQNRLCGVRIAPTYKYMFSDGFLYEYVSDNEFMNRIVKECRNCIIADEQLHRNSNEENNKLIENIYQPLSTPCFPHQDGDP